MFNIGFGGVVGGVGAVINKKPNQKAGHQFLKGFVQGALGGYLLFESKRMIGSFAKTGNYGYVWPSRLVNSAGVSIIENAASNTNFLDKWNLTIGFVRLDFKTKEAKGIQCRILPFALSGVAYGFAKGKISVSESLKTGTFIFTSNLYERASTLGTTAVSTIIYHKNNGLVENKNIVAHEIIHNFQYNQTFGLNTYLDKPFQKLEKNKKWFKNYQSIFYTEYNFLIDTAIYSMYRDYYSNIYEKEASFYTD